MTADDFAALVKRFSAAATAGNGTALANCFTPDGTYFDYIYGPHRGRDSIADMLENLFHRDAAEYDWTFYDPVVSGDIGYAHSLSTFISKVPEYAGREIVIDGISRFVLKDGLIAEYHESVNGGVAHAQLGLAPERMAKVMARWSKRFRDRADVESYRIAVRQRYAKG
ncbi:MAG: nuclear transport factor 2 family protein [Proteobacteria bacterium]|nr:nuclear transport factor 2 family protein [Pseudomonadota bacterium]